jgi:hypothetical protein
MPSVESNQGVGEHSFAPKLETCTQAGCHANATSFDVGGGRSAMTAGIQQLRVLLNERGWLTRSETAPYEPLTPAQLADAHLKHDSTRPAAAALSASEAGALYNYLLLARGSGGGIHNPLYVRELIYDSVFGLTGVAPVTIPVRP